MASFDRSLWRAASQIAGALQTQPHSRPTVTLPHTSWQHVLRLSERWDEAHERGWLCAADHVRDLLQTQLRWVTIELNTAITTLGAAAEDTVRSTARDVYHELVALHEEFDEVEIDLRGTEIVVTTDRIVLEDLDFGPFQIIWSWSPSPSDQGVKVVAQEPNRPTSRDDMSHPHVLDDILCDGAAQQPLRRALQAGRLCDYFLIIRQVLQTYNPSSAYVGLDDWEGARCNSCDGSFSLDELCRCDECDTRVCEDCAEECAECGACGCRSCLYLCTKCEQMFYPRCWPRRLSGPVFVCLACDEQAKTKETVDETTPPAAPEPAPPPREPVAADAEVHTDRLGPAAVPAQSGRNRNRRVRRSRSRPPAARG
jgi:hypothetical protein